MSSRCVERDPVRLLTDADHRRLDVPKRGDRASVGRKLDEDHVVRIEEDPGNQVEPLLRSGGDEQPFGRRVGAALLHDRGDALDERTIAACRSVLQHRAVTTGEKLTGDLPELRPGERVGRRITGRE